MRIIRMCKTRLHEVSQFFLTLEIDPIYNTIYTIQDFVFQIKNKKKRNVDV
jgi:hypothetical protein